jgi:hypothetical protein
LTINFPESPSLNQRLSVGIKSFKWQGEKWQLSQNVDLSTVTTDVAVNGKVVADSISYNTIFADSGQLDCATSNNFRIVLSSSVTISFSNVPANVEYSCKLFIKGDGSSTVTWPGSITWPSSSPSDPAVNKTLYVKLTTVNGGTSWYGQILGENYTSTELPPVTGYIGTYVFTSPQTYNSYSWTVPSGVTYIQAHVWGSGAYPDAYVNGFPGGNGGSGGYSTAVIPVTAGETLLIGVGRVSNNGGASKSFGGAGGGFSSIFRSTTPLIIAGGGGGGQVNGTAAGGAGGGLTGQASTDGQAGGTQSAGGGNGSYLTGGSEGGGGGYYGGGGLNWSNASGGGSGYVAATGNLYTTTTAGDRRTPSETTNLDYPSGNSFGGREYAVGGIGNNEGDFTYGSGVVVIHTLDSSYSTSSAPNIPTTRNIISTI